VNPLYPGDWTLVKGLFFTLEDINPGIGLKGFAFPGDIGPYAGV